MYGKGFLGNMTENLQADCVQSRQAGFVRGCRRQHRIKLVRRCRCSKLGKGTDSGMAERLISIQDTNQFQTLCGSFDENLKLLEQRYHVRMICRGEELRVQGDGAQVELAAGAVTALLQMISNGQAITPQSIHYVSDMVDAGSAGQLAELADDDTVCLTAAGGNDADAVSV